MAKVITVAQKFLSDHPRAGEPTYFVEQILNSLGIDYSSKKYMNELWCMNEHNKNLSEFDLGEFWRSLAWAVKDKKHHTIRSGHRFKEGEMVSLRVWSGKPYRSPQIIFAPDVEVKKVYGFEIINRSPFRNGIPFELDFYEIFNLSKNDGLKLHDFYRWFKWGKKDFDGQIICWGDVDY